MLVSEKVRVITDFTKIFFIEWKNRSYKVTKVGLHHKYKEGKTLYHVFSVVAGSLFLKIRLNTDTLNWTLDEILENAL